MSFRAMADAKKKASNTSASSLNIMLTYHNKFSQSIGNKQKTEESILHNTPAFHGFDHDFQRISVHAPTEDNLNNQAMQSCPVTSFPRAYPFGGARHICTAKIQTKLSVNEPGDQYEQEAERIAEQITGMSGPKVFRQTADSGTSQSSTILPIVHEVLRFSGRPLDSETRAFFEPRFGYNFGQVRVHTDSKAADSARTLNAKAYTLGQNIVFGSGQYQSTTEGKKLLAHELTHVVQQRSGSNILQRKTEKMPCLVHAYDASDPKDTAVIPDDKSGIGVASVSDMVTKVNAYVDDEKNSCSCIARLEINGHGTDGYQSVGNGSAYINNEKALVHDSTDEHLKQLSKIKFCSTGIFMLMGCHVGRGNGKVLLSKLSKILPGKLIGGAQHYTAGTGLGGKKVLGEGDKIKADLTVEEPEKLEPFLTSKYVRWHIVIGGKEYVINGEETKSTEGKAKLKAAEKIKVKTPDKIIKIK